MTEFAASLFAIGGKAVVEPALERVRGSRDARLAIPESARAITLAGLARMGDRRPIVVIVPTSTEAQRLSNDLSAFLGTDDVALFPAWETLPFERVSPSVETMGQRMETVWRLRDPERAPAVVVAPVRALIQRLSPHVDRVGPIVIGTGDLVDSTELLQQLVALGYRREPQVEHRGEVAIRGSIVDVFPSTAEVPIRIDLWGDEVERLTEFSVSDQRSRVPVSEVEIFPARELLPSVDVRERAEKLLASDPWGAEQWDRIAQGQIFDGMESWLPWLTQDRRLLPDLLQGDALIVVIEPKRATDRANDLLAEEADLAATLARTWGAVAENEEADLPRMHVPFEGLLSNTDAPVWTATSVAEGPSVAAVAATGWNPVVGDGAGLIDQIHALLADDAYIAVAADGEGSAQRLAHLLSDQGVDFPVSESGTFDRTTPGGQIVVAPLERGCVLSEAKVAVLTESDVTGRRRSHRQARPRKRQESAGFFEDLAPGNYVVHYHHGVARFGGMVTRAIGGNERDYLLLEYRGDDKLYVPSDQIDAVRHYTGGDSPTLSKMGGADFDKQKAKVRSAVQEIAQELVVLYQTRVTTTGHAYAADTPWQAELEASFPFQETPDQLTAIADVKADMEAESPMDRLVVGDVGFGKTEIAVRSAFKAIQDGKQVACLVPTTLLAQQHFQTFSERYAGFPVRVEVLSRFLTNAQAKKVAAAVRDGEVDLIIGTHRLLSDDVSFKQLGLLIVDEEQRFGVSHKEAIKQFKTDVDVLTLTATPIPRTLEMSLTGIRDLSMLNTPPMARQPILTYVGEHDNRAIAEAIRRELLREGQVFFVHNRVKDIERTASQLRELVPEARIAIAHGQMDEGTLEQVVLDFWEGEYDVLVCTTIIESGIDMPTVNTLVCDRADLLGLGQMHQLRGRVGRAGMRAYAYLLYPRDKALSEDAYERLRTIGEATDLGSGFKIAMRDLEIRGAGNLLGAGQSGHIAAVGYDLYCQMVTEAVAELKGETKKDPVEIRVEVPIDAFLPTEYVTKEEQRLEAYRRLAVVASQEEVEDIRAEWLDRYGHVPPSAEALLSVAGLRAECVRTGVTDLTVTKGPGFGGSAWVARISPVQLPTSKQIRLNRLYGKSVFKEDASLLVLEMKQAADPVAQVLAAFGDLLPPDDE